MIISKQNIDQMIAERGIDWLIDNTCKIIIQYSNYKKTKLNKTIVDKYTEVLVYVQKLIIQK